MFDFTKEVVINSKNFEIVDGKIRIAGCDYDANYIVDKKVYKTPAQNGSNAVLVLNPSTLGEGHYTLNIELGLDRDARQDWASAVYKYKKHMVVDFNESSNANVANLLKAVLTDYKFVYVLYGIDDAALATELGISGFDKAKVYVVGADCNVKVNKITILKYEDDDKDTVTEKYSGKPKAGVSIVTSYTENKVEFGTYEYLLHNLRMPTYENYRFTSPSAVEMPIAGAKYTQYTFLYCVPRPGLGGLSVAGQTNHSTTTHVFYVNESVEGFDEALAGVTIDEYSMKTPAEHVNDHKEVKG